MELYLILVLFFLGLIILMFFLVQLSLRGFTRYQAVFTENTETKLEGLFLFFNSQYIFILNVIGMLLLPVLIYFLTNSIFYVFLAALLLLFLPRIMLRILENKRCQKINETLPDALAQIAGSMRAGSTFLNAIEIMIQESKGPLSQEFSLMLREQRLGTTMSDALDNLGERVQSSEMDLLVAATQISNEVGGNLSEILASLSLTLRRKIEMEGKIKALTSQGIMQGWVVGLLPFGIIAALFWVDPENISPIFTGLLGWIFLAVILINEVLGGLLIRKIVNIDI